MVITICDRCKNEIDIQAQLEEIKIRKYRINKMEGWKPMHMHLCSKCYFDFERFLEEPKEIHTLIM